MQVRVEGSAILIEAQTGANALSLARTRLRHPICIGNKGSRHTNHVCVATGEDALGHLGSRDALSY